VIGGAILLPLPPGNEDLEIGWQLHPDVWGHGYASETTYALAQWAFSQGEDEIFAVVRPDNTRAAATVRRNGMEGGDVNPAWPRRDGGRWPHLARVLIETTA
jgi:RimJ/RimL family protein N-acetyltransferase